MSYLKIQKFAKGQKKKKSQMDKKNNVPAWEDLVVQMSTFA